MAMMSGELALLGLLFVPVAGALLLAAIQPYKVSAVLNVVFCAITLSSAVLLFWQRPNGTLYLLVDDVNTVFLIVNALVGFTTSVFSANYIPHELSTRRLTPRNLRFYHAMYHTDDASEVWRGHKTSTHRIRNSRGSSPLPHRQDTPVCPRRVFTPIVPCTAPKHIVLT